MRVNKFIRFIGREDRNRVRTKRVLFLHLSILMFSVTGIFSKLAANSINGNGIFHINTLLFAGLMLLNCAIYALFWQQNLKNFDANIAYAHRSVYNVWSLPWAVLVFSEKVTVGNVIGTALIIGGILVMQSE